MKLFDRIRDETPAEPDPQSVVRLRLEDWLELAYWAEIGMAYTERECAGPLH